MPLTFGVVASGAFVVAAGAAVDSTFCVTLSAACKVPILQMTRITQSVTMFQLRFIFFFSKLNLILTNFTESIVFPEEYKFVNNSISEIRCKCIEFICLIDYTQYNR